MLAILTDVISRILICVSLITSNVEHLFIYALSAGLAGSASSLSHVPGQLVSGTCM